VLVLGCVVLQKTSQIPLLHTQGFLAVPFPQVDYYRPSSRAHSISSFACFRRNFLSAPLLVRFSLALDDFLTLFLVDPADIFVCTARQKPKQTTAKNPTPN
jgi:hypothetical protein